MKSRDTIIEWMFALAFGMTPVLACVLSISGCGPQPLGPTKSDLSDVVAGLREVKDQMVESNVYLKKISEKRFLPIGPKKTGNGVDPDEATVEEFGAAKYDRITLVQSPLPTAKQEGRITYEAQHHDELEAANRYLWPNGAPFIQARDLQPGGRLSQPSENTLAKAPLTPTPPRPAKKAEHTEPIQVPLSGTTTEEITWINKPNGTMVKWSPEEDAKIPPCSDKLPPHTTCKPTAEQQKSEQQDRAAPKVARESATSADHSVLVTQTQPDGVVSAISKLEISPAAFCTAHLELEERLAVAFATSSQHSQQFIDATSFNLASIILWDHYTVKPPLQAKPPSR